MKQASVQQAVPSATGTQNWTDAIFSGDCKLAISIGQTGVTAINTTTAHGSLTVGATDKTGMGAAGVLSEDARSPTTSVRGFNSNALAAALVDLNSNTFDADANLTGVSHPSNGIQLNWADVPAVASPLMNMLLLGGPGVEFSVKAVALNGTTPVSVTHGLSGAPDALFAFTNCGTNEQNTGGQLSLGFFCRATNTYVGVVRVTDNAGASGQLRAMASASWLVAERAGGAVLTWSATVSNFGASTFDIVANAATTNQVFLVCMKGVTAKCGFVDTPTASGNFSLGASLAVAPSVVMLLPTLLTALDSGTNDDTASHIGIGWAVNNNGTTQYAAASAVDDDAAMPSVCKSYTSNTKCAVVLGVDGAPDVECTVNAWQSNDVQFAATITGSPGAKKMGWMAFGATAVAPTFSVAPTRDSSTSNSITFDGTADQNATMYAALTAPGASVPSAAQIKAGTGGGIVAANSAAVTASVEGTVTVSSLTKPKYDAHILVSNGGGDSAITTIANAFKSAPAGKQYVTVAMLEITAATQANPCALTVTGHGIDTDSHCRIWGVGGMTQLNGAGNFTVNGLTYFKWTNTGANSGTLQGINSTGYGAYTSGGYITQGRSVLESANPAIVDGDVIICPLVTSGGYDITMSADGVPDVDTQGSTARQSMFINAYDASLDAFADGGTETSGVTFYVNNTPPQAIQSFPNPLRILRDDGTFQTAPSFTKLDYIVLRDYITHVEGDALTYSLPGTALPTGVALATESIDEGSGPELVDTIEGTTATAPSSATSTLRATDLTGAHSDFSVPWEIIETEAMPDVEALLQAEAESDITTAGLTVGDIETIAGTPSGIVQDQFPDAGELWPIDVGVTLTVSLGELSEGALATTFLDALTAVPATAVFRSGQAFAQDGSRYVALWPASNAVFYDGPFAFRSDGALIIATSGTIAARPQGVALTYRGEVLADQDTPDHVHNGWPLLDSGYVCMSDIQ